MKKVLCLLVGILFSSVVFSQQLNPNWLNEFAKAKTKENQKNKAEAIEFARKHNLPVRQVLPDGTIFEIQKIENGLPQYFTTGNVNAAQTSRANTLYPGGGLGLNVTGNGYTQVAEWDGGKVLDTHQEFGGRITLGDGASSLSDHSTHVAGTIIAAGVDANAKGMAYEANLTTYEWTNDDAEMSSAASGGLELSNHSYGYIRGWYWDGANWIWYGDTNISDLEDYRFGFYDQAAKDWDDIAYNAPNYLIIKSAGNDRGDGPGTSPPNAEIDGGDDGFDCIGTRGIAKNLLTVGAVHDVPDYKEPGDVSMVYFSSWGPADDGRIKPDIVANGYDLYSSFSGSNTTYGTMSGTSMSSPNTTGTLVLLQQHYQNTHSNTPMKAATIKALVLNTADETGPYTGPDYMYGWGLLNAERAATLISDDAAGSNVIDEKTLTNGGTYTRNISVGRKPLKVTVVWTDPSGTPPTPQLNPPTPMLVNDLDLRISDGTTTYYAWKLDRNNPADPPTNTGENDVDNVETVFIENPTPGTYTITVDHDGTLAASQDFSIVIQGLNEFSSAPATCASLEKPTDGATNVPLAEEVKWSDVTDASSYDVYFGTDPSATNILNGVNQGERVLKECLSPGTTYYLKVYPRNNQGVKTGCSTWSFTTASPATAGLPYSTNFDAGLPAGWTQSTADDFDWTLDAGGTLSGNTGPDDDVTGGGNYMYTEASSPNSPAKKAILYTPYFDLNTISNPELSFYYHMYGQYMGTLRAEIFYNGKWVTLFAKTAQQHSSGAAAWTQANIDLAPYKGCGYTRLRFFGTTDNWASDMAIDNFAINNVASMTLSSLTTVQGPTTDVSAGDVNSQIIRVEIVTVNSGSPLSATAFFFDTQGTVDPNDVLNAKLYYTGTSNVFSTNKQVGSMVVAPNDAFSINPTQTAGTLSAGTNYFWLTYDISDTATACYYVDAVCDSVTIGGTTHVPTVTDPAGERRILATASVFFDDFETDKGWTLTGEFQRAAPQGLGGNYGNADPAAAFSGTNVLGTDLTGLGTYSGDYETNLADRAYQAESPVINCTGKTNVRLKFQRWLNVEWSAYDHAYIDVWDGSAWVQKYSNGATTITDNAWQLIDIDVSAEADGNAGFKVRFAIGATDGGWQYSGWNIDDLTVYADASCTGIPGLWTAKAGSVDWSTTGNWDDNNVPTGTVDVVVPNMAFLPVVNQSTVCNNLSVYDGGALSCGAGGSMTVNGDLQIGQGNSGSFDMSAGSCNVGGNFYSEIGSDVNITGGTFSFTNWSRSPASQFAKGNIHLSGGTINAAGTVYFSLSDLNGIMDGPFSFNVAGSFYINDVAWPTVTGGTITMTGPGTHYFLPSNTAYNALGYNVVLSGGGIYYFQRSDASHGWDIKNNLDLTNGTLQTTNTVTNSYFNVVGNVTIGNAGTFNHGAFNSTVGGTLNIGTGTGGTFSIDAAGNCTVGQVPPGANATRPVNKNNKGKTPEDSAE
ncbi:MAG: S8 family serine peptidase [Bacteroidales bacterium]|nr:S8 family serine peptidase [Bacteroidales bacterium]